MSVRLVGAALIITSCSGFGLSLCAAYQREENILQQIINALTYMENELTYRLTPLPELCCNTAMRCSGPVSSVFDKLSQELQHQHYPDAASCMSSAVHQSNSFSPEVRQILLDLGKTLGVFDLSGQLTEFSHCRGICQEILDEMHSKRKDRLRCYRMLGLCTGIALAILLL